MVGGEYGFVCVEGGGVVSRARMVIVVWIGREVVQQGLSLRWSGGGIVVVVVVGVGVGMMALTVAVGMVFTVPIYTPPPSPQCIHLFI